MWTHVQSLDSWESTQPFYRRTIVFDINRGRRRRWALVQLKVTRCQSSLIISEHIQRENEMIMMMMISLQTDESKWTRRRKHQFNRRVTNWAEPDVDSSLIVLRRSGTTLIEIDQIEKSRSSFRFSLINRKGYSLISRETIQDDDRSFSSSSSSSSSVCRCDMMMN